MLPLEVTPESRLLEEVTALAEVSSESDEAELSGPVAVVVAIPSPSPDLKGNTVGDLLESSEIVPLDSDSSIADVDVVRVGAGSLVEVTKALEVGVKVKPEVVGMDGPKDRFGESEETKFTVCLAESRFKKLPDDVLISRDDRLREGAVPNEDDIGGAEVSTTSLKVSSLESRELVISKWSETTALVIELDDMVNEVSNSWSVVNTLDPKLSVLVKTTDSSDALDL
ncbi:uncharacterized protein KY384_008956 [Bacidia gigantensis]|uniref:uncharacterized protein n=1 Tax=Bacidia gigantensis TaxID=2732470 RepID=UPI001D04D1CF|nr:uncharacterized protein KY384_008956 [Bacidia gigantensis]KAG8525312.1 hypothetical protein KY384_008956 [Bacidia gigantensis]